MKNLKASFLVLGLTTAAFAAAAELYGPLPPPGFVPAAQPASRVSTFLDRWIPAWMKPKAKVAPAPALAQKAPAPAAPRAPVAANSPAAKSVPAPRPLASAAAKVNKFPLSGTGMPLAPKAAPVAAASPAKAKAPAKAPSLAQKLAAREGKPRLAPRAAHPALAAKLPADVKRAPASASPASSAAAAAHALPARPQYNAPVPSAPALPAAATVAVPNLQLPPMGTITINRDPLPPIKLGGRNRAELHNFSRSARLILLPSREYGTARNAEAIAAKYAEALHPKPHQPIRTPYALNLEKYAKIKNPPAPIQYENMVKRLDALFDGLDLAYPKAIQALWDLSQSRDNRKPLQARDSLFAGILSHRAHWEAVSGNLLEESVTKGIDQEERYVKLLFQALEDFDSVSHIDRVIARVNPVRAKALAPDGDKANYAMARRILLGRANPALSAEDFENRIQGALLRDRLRLMRAVALLRATKGEAQASATESLRRLESEGHEEIRQEARLALARAYLQKGEAHNALDLYRNVTKTGKNRLEVLSEQSYAEMKAGLYQESLGKAVGLQSPYFQYGFAPDIHLIEVLSRKSMCDFGGAEEGLNRFVSRYAEEFTALQTVLTKRTNPQAFYEELIAYHANQEPMRFQRYLLRLSPVMENQKVLNGAVAELKKVGRVGVQKYTPDRPAGWDNFVAAMEKSWKRRGEVLKLDAAKSALAEADYMAKRLRSTFGQAELLGLDLATSASRNFNLQSALNFPVRKLAAAEVEKDKFHWPFEQEIWEDELDYLKMKNTSKCAASGARPVAAAE